MTGIAASAWQTTAQSIDHLRALARPAPQAPALEMAANAPRGAASGGIDAASKLPSDLQSLLLRIQGGDAGADTRAARADLRSLLSRFHADAAGQPGRPHHGQPASSSAPQDGIGTDNAQPTPDAGGLGQWLGRALKAYAPAAGPLGAMASALL